MAQVGAQPGMVRTLPSRDVAVVYRVGGGAHEAVPGGLPDRVRVDWSAERQTIRLEPEGRAQSLLIDLAAPSVEIVDSGLRSAISIPVRAKDLAPVRLQDAQLTRRGRDVVAGLACTEYEVRSRRGHGVVCLTGDGVALRAVGEVNGRSGSFMALSVSYGRLPAGLFEVPPGYSSLALPRGLMIQ
jgi:hypothetical protein